MSGRERYHATPYPLQETLAEVDPEETIGIIGSGLTAVDVVAALKEDGHRGRIILMSRHGLLPAPRRPAIDYTLQHFTPKRIEQIAATKKLRMEDLKHLTFMELEHAEASRRALVEELFSQSYGVDRLREQMARIDDGETTYQIALKMMAAAYQDAWYLLDPADKAQALHFKHIYGSLCCPMPAFRAEEILALSDTGQLQVVPGLRSVTANEAGQFVAATRDGENFRLDRVFCAMSEVLTPHPLAARIIGQLVRSGQARLHPFGGLDVERLTSRLLDASGSPQPRLYAIGTMTAGAFYVLNGYVVLKHRAAEVAHAMLLHDARCQGRGEA